MKIICIDCQLYNDGTPIPLFTVSALFNDLYLTSGWLTGNKQSCTKVIRKVFIQQESVCQEVYFVILESDVAQSSSNIVTSEKYLYESPVSDSNNKSSCRIIVYIKGPDAGSGGRQSINQQSTGDP